MKGPIGASGVPDTETVTAGLYTPKLITVLREGYGTAAFRADVLAGLTVAIVALPLSMAIAIASGVEPERGLYAAIVGGFLVSILGGSRFQIGGPAGAFIVLVAATVSRHGLDGLLLATMMSGVLMILAGWLRLGTYIKFVPYPVTVGFTAGIAVIIFASQVRHLFGLSMPGGEPGPFLEKIQALLASLGSFNASALAVAAVTVGLIWVLKRFRPSWPSLLLAVAAGTLAAWALELKVETIGTMFGDIPRTLPMPSLPDVTWDKVVAVVPDALSFAVLGSIESLLSAVIADGMTGRRHRSNCELVAQGVANIGSALFGGFCVTGTIARTATNVRAGAHGPVSGIMHAVFLAMFMLLAAPLASYIPLSALAGVLAVVAWNMIEKHAIGALLRSSRGDMAVLLVTLGLTVFRDLIEAIVVGFALGAILFIDRMGRLISVETHVPFADDDQPDDLHSGSNGRGVDPSTVIYQIRGAFFFGAASTVGSVLDRIADRRQNFVLDCSTVAFFDSTAANVIEAAARKASRASVRFILAGVSADARQLLETHGVAEPLVEYAGTLEQARALLANQVVQK